MLGLALAGGSRAAGGGDDFAARVEAARAESGIEPERGLAALRALRSQAEAGQLLADRIAVDAAECRIWSDQDNSKARAVADAGLAAVGQSPAPPVRDAWLRLRTCRAGVLLDMGDVDAGLAEVAALLALTPSEDDARLRALVLLEQGVYRSRSGDLQRGQRDLIQACAVLKDLGTPRDHELCLGHLANHYRRMGDVDEAHRLHLALRDEARRRGATYDDAIYTYALAQAQQAQERWADASDSYREAAAASQRLGDASGLAYAEHGIADVLMKLKRAREALAHVERAMAALDRTADPRQVELMIITRADALVALERLPEAQAALESVRVAVRQRNEPTRLSTWLEVRARLMRATGRWQEAYLALAEARELEAVLSKQRQSEQLARLRMQFNRQRDAEDLSALRQLNEQGRRLRQTQAVALVLFVVLLVLASAVALRKLRQARRLQGLASTDELTGLANRRALLARADEVLAHARRKGRPLSVLMIDVDHFKAINDRHGHAAGDTVLRHLAQVLTTVLREGDLLGRLGGEEFLAVLPSSTLADARLVAERMRAVVEGAPPAADEGLLRVTVSIGVAGSTAGEAVAATIARADAALYRAKQGGRNAVATDPPDEPGTSASSP